MTNNVLLSAFKHKLVVELENNITNFTNDITYVETILRTAQNKRIRDMVMKNVEKRKKKQNDELNNFFTKYTNFILNEEKNVKSHFFQSLQKDQQHKETSSDVSSSYSTTASEDESHETLNDMYNKRKKLKEVLQLIKTNDNVFQANEKAVHLFLELLQALQNITKESVDCEKMIRIYDNSKITATDKLNNKVIENGNKPNKIDDKIIDYLYNENASFPELSDSTKITMSSNSRNKLSKKEDKEKNNCMNLLAKKVFNLLNDKPTDVYNLNVIDTDKGNVFLNNNGNSNNNTFSHTSNKNLNKEMNNSNSYNCDLEKNMLTLKTKSSMKFQQGMNKNVFFYDNNKNNNIKKNEISSSNMENTKNNKKIGNRSMKMMQNSHLNTEMDLESNSSESSDSSYYSDEENIDKSLGYKKHIITINKQGRGDILTNEINGSSPKFLYSFEIHYEDEADADNNEDISISTCNQEKKIKKIFHFTFLKNGSKIEKVKHLYFSKDLQLRNLKYYNENFEDIESCDSEYSSKNLYTPKKLFTEKNRENSILRKELNMIIDDINNNRLSSLEEDPYNSGFVETNKLRGIYLHLLENQRGLEKELNFYKNELDILHKNLNSVLNKDNTNFSINAADFQKADFLYKVLEKKFTSDLKINTLNEIPQSNYSSNEELKKQIDKLQCELKTCKEELQKEKETVVNLKTASETDKLAIEQVKNELKNNEKAKEDLKRLSQMCEQLQTSIDAERKESSRLTNVVNNQVKTINNMTEELNVLKADKSFDNFKESVLMKVNNTNGEMQILTSKIEKLTEEIDIKIKNEKILNEKLKKITEKCKDKKKDLCFSKQKLEHNAIIMKNMRDEIDYLNEKIENLIKSVKYLKKKIVESDSINKKNKNNMEIEVK